MHKYVINQKYCDCKRIKILKGKLMMVRLGVLHSIGWSKEAMA